jgi:hypothetical protein
MPLTSNDLYENIFRLKVSKHDTFGVKVNQQLKQLSDNLLNLVLFKAEVASREVSQVCPFKVREN